MNMIWWTYVALPGTLEEREAEALDIEARAAAAGIPAYVSRHIDGEPLGVVLRCVATTLSQAGDRLANVVNPARFEPGFPRAA